MTLTTELEELLKEKAQLQRILQSIGEEEEYLGKRLRIFEEKIAVQVLKEKIEAKRTVVEQLKSKVLNLEKRLKEPQKKEPTEVMIKPDSAGVQQPVQSEERQEQQKKKESRFFR